MQMKLESDVRRTVPDVQVTPDMALDWLTRNVCNRRVSPKHVKNLAAMMTANQWRPVGDPIRFDIEGRLLDGQHRLEAVVESETVQTFTVVLGLDPEDQVYMDGGRKRSPGDQLAVALGMPDPNHAAAIVRTYLAWEAGQLIGQNRLFSIPEIVDWATEREDLVVAAVRKARRITGQRIPTSTSVSGAAYIAAWLINPAQADEFWDRLADGAGLDGGNPILHLRGKIQRAKGSRWTRVEEFAYYVRAWNLWRKGESIQRLQGWRDGISAANLVLK